MEALEIIGTAAFAITGAMAAMKKDADIFGVLFLAVITALGGGILRDVLLGIHPPAMFSSYVYIAVALVSAVIVFADAYIRHDKYAAHEETLDRFVNIFDAIGLGVFTVSGFEIAAQIYGLGNPVLLVLMGMTTGIGGGMLRDVLIGVVPKVLRKRIYAVASMLGALLYWGLLLINVPRTLSAALAALFIFTLRILATLFKWNLPHVTL